MLSIDQPSERPFIELPRELNQEIFRYFSKEGISLFRLVCKVWNNFLISNFNLKPHSEYEAIGLHNVRLLKEADFIKQTPGKHLIRSRTNARVIMRLLLDKETKLIVGFSMQNAQEYITFNKNFSPSQTQIDPNAYDFFEVSCVLNNPSSNGPIFKYRSHKAQDQAVFEIMINALNNWAKCRADNEHWVTFIQKKIPIEKILLE